MSLFKRALLGAYLLAAVLAGGWTNPALAETVDRVPNQGNPVGLSGPEQRIALVIGNSHYQNVVQLENPSSDARAVAQLLNSAGFEVTSATDLNHNEMIQVVQDFSARVAGRGPNAVAMVYYAGHGVQLAGENYLVPVDARIASEPDLTRGSLRLVDLMATLDAIPSRMRIVILDACRNNPFPSLNDAGRGLAIVDAPNGSIVGYSTAPGTQALDGTGDHSPYAAAFLRLAHEKNLPIEQLFKRIRLEVNNSTNGQQTPWESSSLTSDFYFFGDTAVAATRAPQQSKMAYAASDLPSRAVRQAYDYVLAENSVDSYQEFIQFYPNDPLSDRIRALLANLAQAKAWHSAVLANSPVAYKSFYEKFSNSSYAPGALKLAAQPKLVPLSQPTEIMTPPSIKLGGLGVAKDNHGPNLGVQGLPQVGKVGVDKLGNGGKIVTLPTPGIKDAAAGNATDKLGNGGKIVTLPSPGSKEVSASNGAATGKIAGLPTGGVSKMGGQPTSKLNGETSRIDERRSLPQISQKPQSLGISRFDSGAAPKIKQQGITNTGGNFHFASSQGRSGGRFGH